MVCYFQFWYVSVRWCLSASPLCDTVHSSRGGTSAACSHFGALYLVVWVWQYCNLVIHDLLNTDIALHVSWKVFFCKIPVQHSKYFSTPGLEKSWQNCLRTHKSLQPQVLNITRFRQIVSQRTVTDSGKNLPKIWCFQFTAFDPSSGTWWARLD